jgi:hypothetical protein
VKKKSCAKKQKSFYIHQKIKKTKMDMKRTVSLKVGTLSLLTAGLFFICQIVSLASFSTEIVPTGRVLAATSAATVTVGQDASRASSTYFYFNPASANAHVAINNAISAAASKGTASEHAVVLIENATRAYEMTSHILAKSNVDLVGESREGVKLKIARGVSITGYGGPGTTGWGGPDSAVQDGGIINVWSGISGVNIQNMTLDGSCGDYYACSGNDRGRHRLVLMNIYRASNVVVGNVKFTNGQDNGAWLTNSTNVEFKGCVFDMIGHDFVEGWNNNNFRFHDCVGAMRTNSGVRCGGSSNGCYIYNNEFYTGTGGGAALELQTQASNVKVYNNYFHDISGSGGSYGAIGYPGQGPTGSGHEYYNNLFVNMPYAVNYVPSSANSHHNIMINCRTNVGRGTGSNNITSESGYVFEKQGVNKAGNTYWVVKSGPLAGAFAGLKIGISAESEPRDQMEWGLTVVDGSGSGAYLPGTKVTIRANQFAAKVFEKWTGDTQYLSSATSETAVVTIPGGRILTLTANYRDLTGNTKYALTVNSGTGSGTYASGTRVPIEANPSISEKVFDKWTGDAAFVEDSSRASTQVTMPSRNIALTATYKDVPVNGSADLTASVVPNTVTSAPKGATGVQFIAIQFANTGLADAYIKYLEVAGSYAPINVANTALYNGDARIGAPTLRKDSRVTYRNLNIKVAAGGKVVLALKGDIKTTNIRKTMTFYTEKNRLAKAQTADGKSVEVGVTEGKSVLTIGTAAQAAPALTLTLLDNPTTSAAKGAKDVQLISMRLANTGEEDLTFHPFGIAMQGTQRDLSDFVKNTAFYIDGAKLTGAAVIADFFPIASFNKSFTLAKGKSVVFTAKGDIAADLPVASLTFSNYYPGGTLNMMAAKGAVSGKEALLTPGEVKTTLAIGSAVRPQLAALRVNLNPRSVQAKPGDKNVTLQEMILKNDASAISAASILIKSFEVRTSAASAGLENVSLFLDGRQLAKGTVNGKQLVFNTTASVRARATSTLALRADIAPAAPEGSLAFGMDYDDHGTSGGVSWSNRIEVKGSYSTLTIKKTNATAYRLAVNKGTGSGTYTIGAKITVKANPAPAGQMFDKWEGDISYMECDDCDGAVVTMPAKNLTLTAVYKAIPAGTYRLAVSGGTGSGSYASGTKVTIAANTATSGQTFDKWTGDTSYLSSATSATATVTIPARAIAVTATYKTSAVLVSGTALVINKVYYNTDTAHMAGSCPYDNEWFEIYNPTDSAISLRNWKVCDGRACNVLSTSDISVPAKGFAMIASKDSTWRLWTIPSGVVKIALGADIGYAGLYNVYDMLQLRDPNNQVVDQVNWGATVPGAVEWPYADTAKLWTPGASVPPAEMSGGVLRRLTTGRDTDVYWDWTVDFNVRIGE